MTARKTGASDAKAEAASFQELGATGLNIQGGIVDEEFLPAIKGLTQRTEVYKQMSRNDGTVGAVLFAIKMLIRGVDWFVKPATPEPRDLPAAEHVTSCWNDMRESADDMVDSALSFLVYGFSPHELVYKRRLGRRQKGSDASKHDDGLIGWRSLPVRAQGTIERWTYDDRGDLESVTQVAPPSFKSIVIPESKLMIFRASSEKGDPEGMSILRTAYIPWYYKTRIMKVEGIGVERDLAGLPYGYVPAEMLRDDAPAKVKAAVVVLKQLLRNIRNDECSAALFPQQYDAEGNKMFEFGLMSTGGRRNFDTNAIIQRYNQEIAMSVMADFILLGHEKVGSFALSDSKTKLFAVAIGAWLDAIKETFNSVAIPRLVDMNPFDTSRGYPELDHGDIESIDLEALGNFITALAGAGMPLFPDQELERYVRVRAGMPEAPVEDDGKPPEPRPEDEDAVREAQRQAMEEEPKKPRGIGVGQDIQSQLLNGAQVQSIVEVASAVGEGRLDRPSAAAILRVAFGLDEDIARSMIPGG